MGPQMYDPVFDPKTQAAKSSIDAALGVAQRVQQRMGAQALPAAPAPQGAPTPGLPPRPQMMPQQPQMTPQQPQMTPQQPQMTPQQPQMPQAWPTMPGANPLLQQLMAQYTTQPAPR